MDHFKIADNLVRLRHAKKITQEHLASFLGVTKASVSKWETGQSTPDISLLPLLAAFFDVTIDDLIGYQPQLSKEQIQKLYQDFAADFAVSPFEDVMAKTNNYVKQYYSCYPFLLQISILWLNHYMLAPDKQRQAELLSSLCKLCSHISDDCKDSNLGKDAIVLQAIAQVQLGHAQEAIELLEDLDQPFSLANQCRGILVQACLMAGNTDRAEQLIQLSMFQAILSLVESSTTYLALHAQNLSVCETTIRRVGHVIDAYALTALNPNSVAVFFYQAAICYAMHGHKQQALSYIEQYASCLSELFSNKELQLHGDSYFNRLQDWFLQMANGSNPPRNRSTVLNDAKQSLAHPAFAFLEGDPAYESCKKKLSGLN